MRKHECIDTQTPVTAIFWEGFTAGSAITALLRVGFPDTDVSAVGVLTGPAPDLRDLLASLRIPTVDTNYYNDCFQDGAVLIIVQAHTPYDRCRALEVIRRHGGFLPPSCVLLTAAE